MVCSAWGACSSGQRCLPADDGERLNYTCSEGDETVPIPFALSYDPAQIDPRFTYALSVCITVDGQLLWVNTEHFGVLTRGNLVTGIEVLVAPV